MVQGLALLVYGFARCRGVAPADIGADEVLQWAALRQLPSPPEPAGQDAPGELDELVVALRLWRHEVDDVAGRQQRDLPCCCSPSVISCPHRSIVT
ncbi:MAG: hypothetical protein QOG75_5626 [Mycobacterium sp.]|nr:hypothetical protein [Mycobacterium sp.]